MTDADEQMPSIAGLRILIVIGPLVLGGAERQALLLATMLRDTWNADVEVWATLEGSAQLIPYLESAGLRWRMVHAPVIGAEAPMKYKMRQVARFVRFTRELRSHRFDVLLPFMSLPNIAVSLAWKLTSIPACIWNERIDGCDIIGRRIFRAARLAARYPSKFIANSRAGAAFLREVLDVDATRIRIISNGVTLSRAHRDRDAWRASLGVDPVAIVVCMIANLHLPKDHATLLRAWHRVIERSIVNGTTVLLVLAGRFVSTHDELVQLTHTLAIETHVRFLGAVEDIAGLLSAADIGVHSSIHEGTPNGLLECMAAGLPVVGTDIPGIRETVGDTADAILCPVGDVEALANRLIAFIDDKALRDTHGSRNRTRIEQEFSPDGMVARFATVIAESMTKNVSVV